MAGEDERGIPQILTLQKLESLGGNMADIASVLHSLSAAISAGSQVSAAERDQLLGRLDGIIAGMNQDRRDSADIHRRLEGVLSNLDRNFADFLEDHSEAKKKLTKACDDISTLVVSWKSYEKSMETLLPQVKESLTLARENDGRDPETGKKLPISDRALSLIWKAALAAMATATALLILSKLLPLVAAKLPTGR